MLVTSRHPTKTPPAEQLLLLLLLLQGRGWGSQALSHACASRPFNCPPRTRSADKPFPSPTGFTLAPISLPPGSHLIWASVNTNNDDKMSTSPAIDQLPETASVSRADLDLAPIASPKEASQGCKRACREKRMEVCTPQSESGSRGRVEVENRE